MVLSKPDILEYIEKGRLRFEPQIQPDQVAQVSIDLRLGRKFSRFRRDFPKYIPAIRVDPSLWGSTDLWIHEESEVYRLAPGEFVLAQTLERVYVPGDLVGWVEGRSGYARVGVTVYLTAPKIANHLDSDLRNGSEAIDRARSAINFLRRYRTRLIADVATGKLDVREAAARLPDESDEPEPLDEANAPTDVYEAAEGDLEAFADEAES